VTEWGSPSDETRKKTRPYATAYGSIKIFPSSTALRPSIVINIPALHRQWRCLYISEKILDWDESINQCHGIPQLIPRLHIVFLKGKLVLILIALSD
jgi:hypothetical protein